MSPPLLFLLDLNFVPFPISCSSFWTLCSYSLNEMQPWTCRIEKCCGGKCKHASSAWRIHIKLKQKINTLKGQKLQLNSCNFTK